MRPVAVDTNVLARGPLGDDPAQQERARKLPRPAVVRTIRTLMEAEGVTVTCAELLRQALARNEEGKADLGECLIWADAQEAGAQAFATFDQTPLKEGWGEDPAPLLEGPGA